MNLLLREPGFKVAAVRLFLVQILIVLLFFAFSGLEMQRISTIITEQNSALMGRILSVHPELEVEVAGFITGRASPVEVQMGKAVLAQYGYKSSMPMDQQPEFTGLAGRMDIKAAAIAAFCFFPLLVLLWFEYRKVYERVNIISRAAEKVVDGNFDISFPSDRDNDFSILYHCFTQMTNRMRLGIEKLKDDKVFLRNMISDISHQLKTPLSSLIMFNELMLDDKAMTTDMREMFLDKSRQQLERIEWLIQSLLKMARLEAGSIEFRNQRMLFVIPAKNAAVAMSIKASEKRIKIIFDGDIDNVWFSGDEEWMTEAISNIIKNSIEHTVEGGEVHICLSESPLFSRISITDNGEGIDKKDIPHIFERFYRSSSAVKPDSVGIGLALSKLVIDGHGGSTSVRSERGKGTEITITFLK